MEPLINILVRTSYRPVLFNRMMDSIKAQTYKNYKIWVHVDDVRAGIYLPTEDNVNIVFAHEQASDNYGYNLYCNTLKSLVTDGWFFFLDDDDVLAHPNALTDIAQVLTGEGVLCQLERRQRIKPSNGVIEPGEVQMPCLLLPAKNKSIADIPATHDGDYQWIKAVSEKIDIKFHELVLVTSRWASKGAME